MPAILLIKEMPKTCKECPCCLWQVCVPADEDIDEYINPSKGKPDCCPLRPFNYKFGALGSVINPQGITLSTASELLDEITGETE